LPLVLKYPLKTVPIHHVLLIFLCDNEYRKQRRDKIMSSSKKVLTIINNDRKLMAMFGGAILDGIILIGLVITASIYFL